MIYFAKLRNKAVKIGCTTDLVERLYGLRSRYGKETEFLHTMPGTWDDEMAMHDRFAHLRLGWTEQFRPGIDLMDFIGRPDLALPDGETIEAIYFEVETNPGLTRVKVDRTLKGKAELVATHRGTSVAALITDLLEGPIDRAYLEMVRDLERKKPAGSK